MTDLRLAPKPRKNPQLWQAYLFWEELMLMRQRHTLRLSSIAAGKSNLDAIFEQSMIAGAVEMEVKGKTKRYETFVIDDILESATKIMINCGTAVPVWPWITGIKGLGAGSQAAKILALIDDIERFDTIAKLWRYAGYGLYEHYEKDNKIMAPVRGKKSEGKGEDRRIVEVVTDPDEDWTLTTARDRGITGYVLPFNKTLKSALYVVGQGFIQQQTPFYTDIYYAEKRKQRELHPDKVKVNGRVDFTDGHIDNRGRRKMIKEFLKNLWLEWRTAEGLPITEKY
jgi:hypothetical protein